MSEFTTKHLSIPEDVLRKVLDESFEIVHNYESVADVARSIGEHLKYDGVDFVRKTQLLEGFKHETESTLDTLGRQLYQTVSQMILNHSKEQSELRKSIQKITP